jgi:hypothetical protein
MSRLLNWTKDGQQIGLRHQKRMLATARWVIITLATQAVVHEMMMRGKAFMRDMNVTRYLSRQGVPLKCADDSMMNEIIIISARTSTIRDRRISALVTSLVATTRH